MPSNNGTPEAWDMVKYTLSGLNKNAKGEFDQFEYDSAGYEFRLSLVIGHRGFVLQHAKAQVAYNNDAGRALVAGCESGHSQETNVSKVADVFYHAVNAFCRPDSQVALEKLGLKVVDGWKTSQPGYTWMGDPSKMKQYVQTFITAIKATPPAIFVHPDMQGVYASTQKLANYKGNLEKVMPRSLFRMLLPSQLVDGLKRAYYISAANAVPYQSLRMLLILTIWHELCHGFVQNLAGELFRRTPPDVSALYNEEERSTGVGESGDYMECAVWGGAVQIDRFPDPADTPSTPWPTLYIRTNSRTPTFKKITPEIIKGFNDNPYTYDLKSAVEALKECPAPAALTRTIKKVVAGRNAGGSVNKLAFWNVRFKYVKGKSTFDIVKKQTYA